MPFIINILHIKPIHYIKTQNSTSLVHYTQGVSVNIYHKRIISITIQTIN